MTQKERRLYLIKELLAERPEYEKIEISVNEQEQKDLLRSLFNVRMPMPVSDEFLKVQDAYLREETAKKKIVDFKSLTPVQSGIYLWKGDITALRCDAIVNAANSRMMGCFIPCHGCVDNAIHTFAGVEMRLACAELMRKQGHDERKGNAKITSAFNLPCRYVIHTVGPAVSDSVTAEDKAMLACCYRSCLELAEQNGARSIAFCCISTGEFHFPNDKAAEIAVRTVKEYKASKNSEIEVIFNVFKQTDYVIYRKLLEPDKKTERGAG